MPGAYPLLLKVTTTGEAWVSDMETGVNTTEATCSTGDAWT